MDLNSKYIAPPNTAPTASWKIRYDVKLYSGTFFGKNDNKTYQKLKYEKTFFPLSLNKEVLREESQVATLYSENQINQNN